MELLSFEAALAKSHTKRHVLLGNGFSIALKPDIFTYTSLLENADFSSIPHGQKIFAELATSDFEAAIDALTRAAKVLTVYKDVPNGLIDQLNDDAAKVKDLLVSAIAKNHPDLPFEIKPEQYAACRKFLSNFDHIYTLNYDILLYWALMHDDVDELQLQPDDGFRHPEDNGDAPYVSWLEAHRPTVHFLHGALHLFDAGSEIIKYTWSKTDIPLLDQIRGALDENKFPLFVSEGASENKLEKILHNAYLHKALRSFQSNCCKLRPSLFIFGHSLAENDSHILKQISRGRIPQVFVSIHGDPESSNNKDIENRAMAMIADRENSQSGAPLTIEFYDADSANVWG